MVVVEVEGADGDGDAEADEEWRQRHSMQPADRPYVELLDIGGSKEYATARPVFYTDRGRCPGVSRIAAIRRYTAAFASIGRRRHAPHAPPPLPNAATTSAAADPRRSRVRRPRRCDYRIRRCGRRQSDDVRHRAPGRAMGQ